MLLMMLTLMIYLRKNIFYESLCRSILYLKQFEDHFPSEGSDFLWNVVFIVLDACVGVL